MFALPPVDFLEEEGPPDRPKEKLPTWGFRVPEDLQSYLGPFKEGEKKGSGLFSRIVVRMLRLSRGVIDEAGKEYSSVVSVYARGHNISEGQALWRLAKKGFESLGADASSKKKK